MADRIKWSVVIALISVSMIAFYFYSEQSLLLRVVALLLVIGMAGALALQTEKGRLAWGMARDARMEVRKVVWPTRKETLQTTAIVIAMVSIIALLLWMLDGLLAFLMRQLLGHGA